eukprot:2526949-Pyramimonas_sp.AAC.1
MSCPTVLYGRRRRLWIGRRRSWAIFSFCFTADMSKVVLSDQQHRILNFDRVTTTRVYVTAAAKRAAVVKDDDLLAKADIQANPVKVSKARCTELKTWFDSECFEMPDIPPASNIMTSRYVYKWKFVKNGEGEMQRT